MSKLIFLFLCSMSSLFCLENLEDQKSEQALKQLQSGNRRFVLGNLRMKSDLLRKRESLLTNQSPFAIIVSCADSRLPPEIIFDQSLGDLFVVRIAGNVVGPLEMDTIEFASARLGCPLILVLGHENCGAVLSVLNGETAANYLTHIEPYILPAVQTSKKTPGDRLVNATYANVGNVVKELSSSSVLSNLIQQGKLKIVGGFYHLKNGNVQLLNLGQDTKKS